MGVAVGQFVRCSRCNGGAGGSLGETFPADYVFRGAVLYYNANLDWPATVTAFGRSLTARDVEGLQRTISMDLSIASFPVQSIVLNADSANLTISVRADGDLSSINDAKAILDGVVTSANARLRASMVRFISNPRRDSQPQAGTIPGAAANSDKKSSNPPGVLDVASAADWWTSGAASIGLDKIGAGLGISTSIVGIGAALLLLFLIKR